MNINLEQGLGIMSNPSFFSKILLILVLIILVPYKQEINAQPVEENSDTKKLKESTTLGISPIFTMASVEKNTGIAHLSPNIGKGLLAGFYYNLNINKVSVSTGLKVGVSTMKFSFDLPDYKYNLLWHYSDYHSEYAGYVALPIKLGLIIYRNTHFDLFTYSEININSLLHIDSNEDYSMADTNNEEIKILTTEYKSTIKPKMGVEIGFGIKRNTKNKNSILASLFFHTSFSSQMNTYYTFFTGSEYFSEGIIRYSNTFIGLNIAYEFDKN
ncbi:MAG: hypothetical protein GXO79_07310 [Chlorobi bacterium]|nr:hypothetical protein [Chlorobiota bacterium]